MQHKRPNVNTDSWWQVCQGLAQPRGLWHALVLYTTTWPRYVTNNKGVLFTYRKQGANYYWLRTADCGLRLVPPKGK